MELSIYSLGLWIYLLRIFKINRIIQDITSWVSLLSLSIFPPNIHPSCTTLSIFDFCILLLLRRNNFQYFTSKYDVNFELAFVIFREFSSFYRGRVLCFVKRFFFSCHLRWFCAFPFFVLFMWYMTFIEFLMLNRSYIPGVNFIWSLYILFLVHCWIWFGNILLKIFFLICIHNGYWSSLVFFFVFYWLCFCCAGVHA